MRIYDPERDREAKFRFGFDPAAAATAHLAHASWQLGNVTRVRELIEESVARAVESAHAPTLANTDQYKPSSEYSVVMPEPRATPRKPSLNSATSTGLRRFCPREQPPFGWARARLGDRETGVRELRESIAAHTEQENKLFVPFYQAELEAEGQDVDGAITSP